jgi:hypothetical protein
MQPDDALNDAALDRDLQQAFAIEPSPGFVARVRTRVAQEPMRSAPWRVSLLFAAGAIAAAIVIAFVAQQPKGRAVPVAAHPLASRTLVAAAGQPIDSRVPSAAGQESSTHAIVRRPATPLGKAAPHEPSETAEVLIDPREAAALRALIAGVGTGRLDLTPILRASIPPAMDLPPIESIQIPDITIELLAPFGAEGVRQ